LAARTALGRLGEPDDIGTVIAALLGADLAWITAQDIEVSGGYNL
jgi:NAD(P)-dependent dehydrogenase (short-subunit alcohol dehydrogenase family)